MRKKNIRYEIIIRDENERVISTENFNDLESAAFKLGSVHKYYYDCELREIIVKTIARVVDNGEKEN